MNNLIPKQQAEDLINEIERIDLKSAEGQEKLEQLVNTRIINSLGIMVALNPHPQLSYVRARDLQTTDHYFREVTEHSYNRNPDKINRGRANFAGQSIFYCGRIRATALAEVDIIRKRANEKKIAYGISRWIFNKPSLFLAILNPDTMHKMKVSEPGEPYLGELDGVIKGFGEFYHNVKGTNDEGIVMFYKYLSDKFTELITDGEEQKYIFTSIFAKQIFDKIPHVSGILYQSVKMMDSYNLAIKPHFIDNNYLIPTHFFKETYERITPTDLESIKFEKAKSFDIDNNFVEWD